MVVSLGEVPVFDEVFSGGDHPFGALGVGIYGRKDREEEEYGDDLFHAERDLLKGRGLEVEGQYAGLRIYWVGGYLVKPSKIRPYGKFKLLDEDLFES
jgi:hypothetical protein